MAIREEFNVHMLNELGIDQAKVIAEVFSTALTEIERIIPKGRELSIVVTKLQEAAFFAKRGMAIDPVNQLKRA